VVRQGKIVRHKAPLKLKEIWALRVRLQMDDLVRELALLNLGIDSKLRRCDLVALKATRDAVQAWIGRAGLEPEDFLFPSRLHDSPHLGTRQYARILGH
jgi:hypothetical protein